MTIVAGKSKSIAYPESVSVALVSACEAHAPYYIVICDLSGSFMFFHIIFQTLRFSGKKKLLNVKMCFNFLYSFV